MSQNQRDILYKSKKKTRPYLKQLIQTRQCHDVGRFKNHPNVYAMKEGGTIFLAVVLLLTASGMS